jgi:DNA-binding SARP family transcriptional activator/type II secretory pathway predicted ATPase ExeA
VEQRRYLRCLGQPAFFAPNGEPVRFRTKKHLALLIYLAVENRSHRRDRLAELLWPKVSPAEARHSLATALSILRPRVGSEGLETSRDQVRLHSDRLALDLERLEHRDVLGTEVTGVLEVASFLDGFDISDSSEFTHWKDRQQARLLPLIKDALMVLIDRSRRNGDSRQMEHLADQMLAFDDLSEDAIRAKMEARAFAGDRLTALEIFEGWKRKLADELFAAPSDLVEGMAIRLRRRGWERTTLANIPNVPTDQWRGRPFIGRTAEYRVLYELWEGVRRGAQGHSLILGDSGVGKTTLVQRLTTAAGLEGAAISRVQCYDLEREIPYSTLSSLILGLLECPGVSGTSPAALAELTRIVPLLREHFPSIPAADESRGETARIRLTDAFCEMLSAIAEEHPVILVIDDIHLADDVSLAVLHLIIVRAVGHRIMLVLIARSGELSQSPHAARIRESTSDFGIREIELNPLNESDTRRMLASLVESDAPQPTASEERALLRAAAGFPMVLEFLVEDWKANRERSLALSLNAMTTDLGAGEPIQAAYGHILDRITRKLSSVTRSVLNLASILGHRLNDLSMYAIVDLSIGQTVSAMAELVALRLLRDGVRGLEFTNELVRAATYVGVPLSLRRVLHANIADRFMQQHFGVEDDVGLEVAWHCIRGGRVLDATPYLLRGARQSVRHGALDAAERALTTALPTLRGDERKNAVLLLVEVLQEQGRWPESHVLLRQTEPNDVTDAHHVFSIAAQHWSTVPSPDQIHCDLWRLKSIIETSSEPWLSIKAAKVAAWLTSSLRDQEMAKRILRSLGDIGIPTLDKDDLARLADAKAQLLYYAFERGSCRKELGHIADHLRDERVETCTTASLHTGLGVLACGEGSYLEAKKEFSHAYHILTHVGNDTLASSNATQIALCCYRLGEYQESIEWSQIPIRFLASVPFGGYPECQTARNVGTCHALLGDERKAFETMAQYESRVPESLPPWIKQAWAFHKADILFLLGYKADALTLADLTLGDTPCLHDWAFAGAFARWRALSAKGTAKEDAARLEVESLVKNADKFDALDQVEIMYALLLLGSFSRQASEALHKDLHGRLLELPAATAQQLLRLGLLPYN